MDKDITNLLDAENDHIKKLQEIVRKTIEDENLIIQNLLNPPKEILNQGQKISDKVAKFGGSWAFIISFFIILAIWITFNVTAPKGDEFDPYPFILMNLILSCIAASQATLSRPSTTVCVMPKRLSTLSRIHRHEPNAARAATT